MTCSRTQCNVKCLPGKVYGRWERVCHSPRADKGNRESYDSHVGWTTQQTYTLADLFHALTTRLILQGKPHLNAKRLLGHILLVGRLTTSKVAYLVRPAHCAALLFYTPATYERVGGTWCCTLTSGQTRVGAERPAENKNERGKKSKRQAHGDLINTCCQRWGKSRMLVGRSGQAWRGVFQEWSKLPICPAEDILTRSPPCQAHICFHWSSVSKRDGRKKGSGNEYGKSGLIPAPVRAARVAARISRVVPFTLISYGNKS